MIMIRLLLLVTLVFVIVGVVLSVVLYRSKSPPRGFDVLPPKGKGGE